MVTKRRVLLVLVCLVVVLLAVAAAGGWVAYRAKQARVELEAARGSLRQLVSTARTGDVTSARSALAQLQVRAARADRLTHDPVWSLASIAPIAGNNVQTVRGITAGINDLAQQSLPPLINIADTVQPSRLRLGPATVDVQALRKTSSPVSQALAGVLAVDRQVRATPDTHLIGQVATVRQQVLQQLAGASSTLRRVDLTSRVLPGALGADGPVRWFVAFQTPAEARGSGGLLGAYALLTIDNGKLSLDEVDTNGGLPDVGNVKPALPDGFRQRWAAWTPTKLWINGGVSADFPTTASIWAARWQKAGTPVDGILTVDPAVLGYLLDALGPVEVDGRSINGDNAAKFVLEDAYRIYPVNDDREAALRVFMRATFRKLLTGGGDPVGLVKAFARGAREGRILAAMPDRPEQTVLKSVPIGGALPAKKRPYLGVYLNDAGGSKLDTYTTRAVDYRTGACTNGRRTSTVTVRLGNEAPTSGLPDYVVSRGDRHKGKYPRGQRRAYLSFYTSPGTALTGAEVDGRPATMEAAVELEHPVFSTYLLIDPGKKRTVTLRLSEPALPGTLDMRLQPLVRPATVTQQSGACT